MSALNIDFKLAIGDCCDQVEFCDTTCLVDPAKPINCCDGYGVDSNTSIYDITRTEFHWVFPDGTTFQNVDPGFLLSKSAFALFTITAGTVGGIFVKIDNQIIGSAYVSIGLNSLDLARLLINDINARAYYSGWYAFLDESTLEVRLQAVEGGTINNNKVVDINISGDVAVTQTFMLTAGGTGEDCESCYTWALQDLYGSTYPCPVGYPKWPDGVYSLTYIIFGADGEITRRTKQFFFDCNVRNCFKALLLKVATVYPCHDKDTAVLIANVRNKIDAANEMFLEGDYACANTTIKDAANLCTGFCTNC